MHIREAETLNLKSTTGTKSRLCSITAFNKAADGQPYPKRADHLPRFSPLVDAIEDLTIDHLSQQAFAEMLKNWHKKKKPKPEKTAAQRLNEQINGCENPRGSDDDSCFVQTGTSAKLKKDSQLSISLER